MEFRITHGLLSQMFSSLASFGRPQSDIVEICSTLLDVDVDKVAMIIKSQAISKDPFLILLQKTRVIFQKSMSHFIKLIWAKVLIALF